jgi:three-Cys-motif partner protein
LSKRELPEPEEDGLVVEEVGEWSLQKHYFLERYLAAFTSAMRKKRWSGLHYIDLFAGPGIVRIKGTRQLSWGSPLIAAQNDDFTSLHLCEKDAEKYQALRERIRRLPSADRVQLHCGDANAKVRTIISNIAERSLSVAFLDPYGLHLDFETVRTISNRRVDLIVFFPDHLDALRNCGYVYQDDPNSNLDRFLGEGVDWRAALKGVPNRRWAEILRMLYQDQMKKLGYTEFRDERIADRERPLYKLILCSHDAAASKIWEGISNIKPDGQRTFGFGK